MPRTQQQSAAEAARHRLEFGDRLRAARITAGFATVKEAADRAGVGETVLRQWERGRSAPSVQSLQKLVSALLLDRSYLFPYPTDPPPPSPDEARPKAKPTGKAKAAK